MAWKEYVCCQLPEGRRILLHCGDARCLDYNIGWGAGLAVLDFSVSQIVQSRGDVKRLLVALCVERSIPCVCIVAHDHIHGGYPPPADCGVTVRIVQPAACLEPNEVGWCRCSHAVDHRSTRLETSVCGSSMAVGITEYAFDAAAFVYEIRRLVSVGALPRNLTVRARRPFPGAYSGVHWLLRSLTLIRIHCPSSR